jgi:uncharacterized glyoxalase superfamily protein PhnB
MTRPSASASVEVGVDPATAFRVFTEEIGQWWLPGPINAWDSARSLGKRFEPGPGGRFLEVYDAVSGEGLELGRITVWEPGSRLVYRSSVDDSEVDIRFEATGTGTLIRVEQYLLPGGDAEKKQFFWPSVIHWLPSWLASPTPRVLARLSVALYYEDPGAAARWLARAFGFRSWDRIPAEGEQQSWIELHIDNVAVLLFPLEEPWSAKPVTHTMWVYVDDLDAHFARAEASGANIISGIHQHGYRSYDAEDLAGHRWTFVQALPSMRR